MAIKDQLISYWDLDDLTDKHGSNDMTNNNGVSFVTDGGTTVADFESASEQSLSRAHANVVGMDSISDFTIAGFMNIEKLPNNGADKQSWGLLSKYSSGTGERSFLVRANDYDNDLEVQLTGNSANTIKTNTRTDSAFFVSGDIGNWISIIATYDVSTNNIVIYKNNVVVAETQSSVGTMVTLNDADTPLYIGMGNASSSTRKWFDGKMKYVGMWGRVLTSDERDEYHNSGDGKAYADLGGSTPTLPTPNALAFGGGM